MDDITLVIMAGGKGTRIRDIVDNVPKPMINVRGKPVLQHQLEFFRRLGFQEIDISIGYLGHVIKDYFGDGGNFGIEIKYLEEQQPMGTAGALHFLKNSSDLLLVVNGDLVLNFDFVRMLSFHKEKNADITLFTHPNQHPYDSALIDVDADSRIRRWWNKEEVRTDISNRVNAGIHLIRHEALEFDSALWKKQRIDLDRDILQPGIKRKRIYAYDSPEYVKDMGTPERLRQVERDMEDGIVAARNLKNPQRAIFLDRDGTINQLSGYITHREQLKLLDGVSAAIRRINASRYLAFVVTNQPVIARGECTFEEMHFIHARMEYLLGLDGAYLDGIEFCPHHPDIGFPGEVTELKISCECRKPAPGMLLSLAGRYHISLSDSWMIGDSATDMEAGRAAGCRTFYLGMDEEVAALAEGHAINLYEAVDMILNEV